MGTNFYLKLQENPCEHCGRGSATHELHIGKSSAGWYFGLRIYPLVDGEPNDALKMFGIPAINELEDWLPLFAAHDIFDEYGDLVKPGDLISNITERSHPNGLLSRLTAGRHHMGPYGHLNADTTFAGKGTYDLINHDFS